MSTSTSSSPHLPTSVHLNDQSHKHLLQSINLNYQKPSIQLISPIPVLLPPTRTARASLCTIAPTSSSSRFTFAPLPENGPGGLIPGSIPSNFRPILQSHLMKTAATITPISTPAPIPFAIRNNCANNQANMGHMAPACEIWSEDEKVKFERAVCEHGCDFKRIAETIGTKNIAQVRRFYLQIGVKPKTTAPEPKKVISPRSPSEIQPRPQDLFPISSPQKEHQQIAPKNPSLKSSLDRLRVQKPSSSQIPPKAVSRNEKPLCRAH
eukprot:TRINITY_DN5295_c0_g1_i1.p1 TRINITY_DN5295_c0_g1~~TRINITY_DN5295_c0_g1_i1.p1  ORF type:complete len:266 (+),score=47.92 TRINITY_DN5295_c0_g1_i1:57-854(+)